MIQATTYNNGNGSSADLIEDWKRLLKGPEKKVIGLCETGDRGREISVIDKLPGVTVLRRENGGANRVALLLKGVTADAWGVFPLNPGGEPVERSGKGQSDGTAEAKFIVWADIENITTGMTHFIPSSANREDGGWAHPKIRDVYRTQVDKSVEWITSEGEVLMGDLNGGLDYDLLAPLRAVAQMYTRPSHGLKGIDYICVQRGSGITVEDVTALTGYSSDHKPVRGRLVVPVTHTRVPTHLRVAYHLERTAAEVSRQDVKARLLDLAAAERVGTS